MQRLEAAACGVQKGLVPVPRRVRPPGSSPNGAQLGAGGQQEEAVVGLFVTYANLDRPQLAADAAAPRDAAGLEAWVLSRLHATIREVRGALDAYQLRRALGAIEDFVQEDLSNWYVRRRRRASSGRRR